MFDRPRVIPCLLIDGRNLVKTVRFKQPRYLGDPINAIKIFNEKEVDELCVLDITRNRSKVDFEYLEKMATEAFMPLSYGGGIDRIEQAAELFHMGFEKIVLNTSLVEKPNLITSIAERFGSQSVIASIDVKKNLFGKRTCYIRCATKSTGRDPLKLCVEAEKLGAGEILLNSISNDGMMNGYDISLIKEITSSVNIPVIACGGAGQISHFREAVIEGGAHAVAGGSIFVYYGPKKAVLINYPTESEMQKANLFQGV